MADTFSQSSSDGSSGVAIVASECPQLRNRHVNGEVECRVTHFHREVVGDFVE